jgi:hypothetical protein
MPRCVGSKYTERYYSEHGIRKIATPIKRTVGIGNEIQLRRIIKEVFKLDYDKLKSDYIEGRRKGTNILYTILYADGMGSISILFEEKTATLIYTDGKKPKFSISLT